MTKEKQVIEVESNSGSKSLIRNEDGSIAEFNNFDEAILFVQKKCGALPLMLKTRIRAKTENDV